MLLTQVESLQVGQLHDGFHACPGDLTFSCIQARQMPQLADSVKPQAHRGAHAQIQPVQTGLRR